MPIISSGSASGAGALLTVVQYAPGTLTTYNVSGTTLTALDTTNLTVSFVVPGSGNVVVDFTALCGPNASGTVALGLLNHSGGAQLGVTYNPPLAGNSPATVVAARWYLTGLSAGTSLGIDIAAGSTGGTSHVYAQGATGAAVAADAPPAVIAVWQA